MKCGVVVVDSVARWCHHAIVITVNMVVVVVVVT